MRAGPPRTTGPASPSSGRRRSSSPAGKFELAAILSYENGKSRYESIGEVDEAIDFMRYYANEMELEQGLIQGKPS